jgi:tRNA (cmo5U34)-methyltransferase
MSAQSADMNGDSRGHLPAGKWEFDASVTQVFDDMLERSVPQYEVMRGLVDDLIEVYRVERTAIVDLGASRGEAIARAIDKHGAHNTWGLVETSPPMLEELQVRFRGLIDCGVLKVFDMDLRREFPPLPASVILSVLTLQFIPIEYRQGVVRRAYQALSPGGAFIVVEKVLGDTAELDEVMVNRYLRMKADNGYTQEEIDRKRLSLEGALVSLTAQWNEELLRRCGFQHVDCFWRWMNFAGWVAVK